MARIALMIGFAVAGAVAGFLTAGASFAFAGLSGPIAGAMFGGSVGAAVGGTLGGILFPGHQWAYGARLNDLQTSSSANGSPLPYGYGGFRIGGQIIWAPGLKETVTTQHISAKGGPTTITTTYTYTASFAAAFCQGPGNITRVWLDSRLVYDVTSKGAISDDRFNTGIPNPDDDKPWIIQTEVVTPTTYPGNQIQQPDPTVQASEGINNTPAFRNLIYLVYTDLPLISFGNRLPNCRAEVSISTALSYLKDTYPGQDPNAVTTLTKPSYTLVDMSNRKGYILDDGTSSRNIQQINLIANANAPLQGWTAGTVMTVGEEILDSNGNVQLVVEVQGSGKTNLTAAPDWNQNHDSHGNPVGSPATEGSIINDFGDPGTTPTVWFKQIGPGPNAIVIQERGTLNPVLLPGDVVFSTSYPPIAGIDPSGNIWQVVGINGAGGQITVQCYDPTSFLAKFRFVLPAPYTNNNGHPAAISFSRTQNGDFMFVASNTQTLGRILIYNLTAKTGPVITPPMFGNINFPTVSGQKNIPCAAPNGHLYVAFYLSGTGSNGNTYVADYDPISGVVTQSSNLYSAISSAGASNPNLELALWNPADDTLICFTSSGMLVKIDPVSKAILATSADGALYINSNQTTAAAYFTQNGILPAAGILYGFRSPSGAATGPWNLCGYDKNLTRVFDVPMTNWFLNPTAGFDANSATRDFDANTQSLLVAVPSSSTYNSCSYRVYINRQTVNGQDLGVIVTDLLTRAGADPAHIDVSLITGTTVLGFPVTQNTSVKSLISVLCSTFYFDIVESDFKLKCIPRGATVNSTIPEADLGLATEQYKLQESIAQENDLPLEVTVLFSDPSINYQQGKAHQKRNSRVKKTKNRTTLETPITMTADFAAQLANKALKTVWTERNAYDFRLWKYQYLILDPTDVIQFTYEGMPFIARLVKESIGVNMVMEISGVSEDASSYLSTVKGSSGDGFVQQFLGPVGPTLLFMFDVPLLQDTDASPTGSSGYYYGMSSIVPGWSGAALFTSSDGESWNNVGFSSHAVPFGGVFSALAAPATPWTWDTVNTIKVSMATGTLSSITPLQVLNGGNAAILGDEVIQFQNAVLNTDGTYTLSIFLRGRRGTEWACNQHLNGETFFLLNSTDLQRNIVSTSSIGQSRQYKAVTINQALDGSQPQNVTLQGMDLRPYAPAHFMSSIDSNNNFNFSWVRRTRIGGAWLDGTGTVPLMEATEDYEVDIMLFDGGGSNIPMYDVSPVSAGSVQMTQWGGIFVPNLTVGPFTITWADGTVAQYLGTSFTGPSANVPQPGYLVVHDPNRTGDVNGGSVTYTMDNPVSPHYSLANQPGYYYVGLITALPAGAPVGTTVRMGPGGSDVTVRKQTSLTSPSYIYTAAQQTADFGEVVAQTHGYVRAKVFQVSAAVGIGFAAQNTAQPGGEIFVLTGGTSSGDATSINGIPIVGTPLTGQVLEYNGTNWVPTNTAGASRVTVSTTTPVIGNGVFQYGTMTLAKALALLGATTNHDCRVQLYSTAAYRSADQPRPIGVNPAPGSLNGIIADFVLTAAQGSWDFSPSLLGANRDTIVSDTIYYTITNLGTSAAITVGLTYLPLEQ